MIDLLPRIKAGVLDVMGFCSLTKGLRAANAAVDGGGKRLSAMAGVSGSGCSCRGSGVSYARVAGDGDGFFFFSCRLVSRPRLNGLAIGKNG